MKINTIWVCLLAALGVVSSRSALAQQDITDAVGTISAQYSDSPVGEELTNLIDNSSATKYLTFHPSAWVKFKSAKAAVVTKYALTSANDAPTRDPKRWTFSGSNNDTTWTILDTRSKQDFAARALRQEFSFTNSTAYTYYRLQATNNSGGILQLAEWEIYGSIVSPPLPVVTLYPDCSFGGTPVALDLGSYTTAQLAAAGLGDNQLSSLKVPAGYEVLLYDFDNFQINLLNEPRIILADRLCLAGGAILGFDNKTSSIQIRVVAPVLTSPAASLAYTVPATVPLTATPPAGVGDIKRVEFLNGSTLIGSATTAPYTYNWVVSAAGSYKVMARTIYANEVISEASPVLNVEVNNMAPDRGDWTNFQYPKIIFQDLDSTSIGSQVFHTAIPDPEGTLRAQVLALVKKIHYDVNDSLRSFTKLHFTIQDFDGVAYKYGAPPEIFIVVSTRYLAQFFTQNNGDYSAIRREILGVLSHEGTHGYQYEPKNAGGYDGKSEFFGFIEGLADAVRISVGLHTSRTPALGGSWRDGYTTSGFFIYWLMLKKDPAFMIKFQHTARTYENWSWDAACKDIVGVGVQPLWDEYQAWIPYSAPSLPKAPTSPTARIASAKTATVGTITGMERYTCTAPAGPKTQTAKAAKHEVIVDAATNSLQVLGNTADVMGIQLYTMAGRPAKATTGQASRLELAGLRDGLYLVIIQNRSGYAEKKKIFLGH